MENRIRELRVARSWSQATLGDALGVSRQTVNAIENGRYDPSLPLASKIAALFEEPIEALFTPDFVDVELQPDCRRRRPAAERSAHVTTLVERRTGSIVSAPSAVSGAAAVDLGSARRTASLRHGHTRWVWTCPDCGRRFVNQHQWHSCIELSLGSALADASEHARRLYRAVEEAVASCGEFRVHPQKTRIAFITTMTFAGVKLARRWVDVSFITAEPIDDPLIDRLECYGPTSFAHTIRVAEPGQLDATVRGWLCRSWRRGNREALDSSVHVQPLTGRALELVVVPLRSIVVERADGLALKVPRYAAEVFGAHPAVLARIGRSRIVGEIEQARDEWGFVVSEGGLRELGLGVGDTLDLFVRADI